jgi:thiol-disulfide isomerase/thioredoxin
MSTILLVVAVAFIGLVVGMQLLVRGKARAMLGKPLPALTGATGARLAQSARALVYFFSPSCGACVRLTPRFRELSQKNPAVFVVDVMQDMALARGLGVMGTPSVVEIADGKIVGYHVGNIPPEVMTRFA